MVLGIGEGKITLTLEKSIFSPGEPIRGKAILSLNQPKKARALRLDIMRVEKKGGVRIGPSSAGYKSSSRTNVEFTKQLSGEKLYRPGESFDFEVLAPSFALPQLPPELSMVAGLFGAALPRYFVKVSLDTQMEFDISEQVEIQIKNAQQ